MNCDSFQRYITPPVRFKFTLSTEKYLLFGDDLSIDLVLIGGNAVRHIIDTAIRFRAVIFLDSNGETYGQSVERIWSAFAQTWVTMYTRYPNRLPQIKALFSHQIVGSS